MFTSDTGSFAFLCSQHIQRHMSHCCQYLSCIPAIDRARIFFHRDVQYPVQLVVSRPREPPPQPLAERYVNLSIHTAPIRKTDLPFLPANGQTVAGSSLLFLPEILTSESCADAAFCIFAAPTLSGLCLCVEIVNIMLNDYNVRSSQSSHL